MVSIISCAALPGNSDYPASPQFLDGRFHNTSPFSMMGPGTMLNTISRYLFEQRRDITPELPVPLQPLNAEGLRQQSGSGMTVYRLGHSSLLLSIAGEFWLIDPVFSERASPVSWAGPRRFHPTPITIEQLPEIRGVIISHDHYDHLDRATIRQLKDRVASFVTPLGVGRHLQNWGVDADRIHQLDWWQSIELGELKLTATPAQHFSGRGLTDSNRTLWASWVIRSSDQSIFFSGDSGYFDGFREIGNRLGPFDLTIIENGAWDRNWDKVHMRPEQTLQAHLDLGGRVLMPVHNGTFDLALHPWHEPFARIRALADEAAVQLVQPQIGEQVAVGAPAHAESSWWANLNPDSAEPVMAGTAGGRG